MTGANVNYSRSAAASTSLGLLARVKAREHGSWEQLVALYTPLIYHWCRKARLPAGDAEDVGQEVFRAVFRNIAAFGRDQAGQSFRAWLRRITQSKVIDRARQKQPVAVGGSAARDWLESVAEAGDSSDADATVEWSAVEERRILLRQALKQLEPDFKPETWRLFWLVIAESRSPAAVAQDLGVNVNSVYLAKSRVLQRLRAEFAELVEPDGPAGPPGNGPPRE